MVIIDNNFAKATYSEEADYILFEYKRCGSSTEFRHAWNKVGDFTIEKLVHKCISDSRNMSVISPSDQEWFVKVYVSRLKKHLSNSKKSFSAIVLDKDIFAEMSAKMIFDKMETYGDNEGGFIQYFDNVESAEEWIKNVD